MSLPKDSKASTAVMREMREFHTGATRDADDDRPDYEGCLSPLVLERFGEYMVKHRKQADGKLRDSDNWQKGIPRSAYLQGLLRHVMHLWQRHRGWPVRDPLAGADLEEDICAALFNLQGYLHEYLKAKNPKVAEPEKRPPDYSVGSIVRQHPKVAGIIKEMRSYGGTTSE